MPSGAKKRKAAKKKQEQIQASSTPQINLKSNNNNYASRSQGEKESCDSIRIEKDTEGRIEIIDSSHDHDKSSSSTTSSSSDDESMEAKKIDEDKETGDPVSQVITVSSVPSQPVPVAGDAAFMGSTANAIVENTGLMDSTKTSDTNSEKVIEILPVDTTISNNVDENTLPKPNDITTEVSPVSEETRQSSSSATDSDKKEEVGNTSPLPESKGAPEGTRESEVVVCQEEEAPLLLSHGVAQRTSWFSCCGLFDVVAGSNR